MEGLPRDLVVYFCSMLPTDDLLALRGVSNRLSSVISESDFLWRRRLYEFHLDHIPQDGSVFQAILRRSRADYNMLRFFEDSECGGLSAAAECAFHSIVLAPREVLLGGILLATPLGPWGPNEPPRYVFVVVAEVGARLYSTDAPGFTSIPMDFSSSCYSPPFLLMQRCLFASWSAAEGVTLHMADLRLDPITFRPFRDPQQNPVDPWSSLRCSVAAPLFGAQHLHSMLVINVETERLYRVSLPREALAASVFREGVAVVLPKAILLLLDLQGHHLARLPLEYSHRGDWDIRVYGNVAVVSGSRDSFCAVSVTVVDLPGRRCYNLFSLEVVFGGSRPLDHSPLAPQYMVYQFYADGESRLGVMRLRPDTGDPYPYPNPVEIQVNTFASGDVFHQTFRGHLVVVGTMGISLFRGGPGSVFRPGPSSGFVSLGDVGSTRPNLCSLAARSAMAGCFSRERKQSISTALIDF